MRAIFLVAALALVAGASAQSMKGKELKGYTFGSDVGPWLNVSMDVKAIKDALNSPEPNFKLAQSIYMDGMNARRPDGSLFSLRTMATEPKSVDTPFWKLYTQFYKTPYWLDDNMMRAFGGIPPYVTNVTRAQVIVKSLQSALTTAYVMHELDEAVEKLKAGKKQEASDNVDQGWAIFVGGDINESLWTVAAKRANEYGTKLNCDISRVSDAVRKSFLAAQKAAQSGDVKALEKARSEVQRQLTILFTQAIITYSHEMYLDKAAGVPADEHQSEAYSFFRVIAPLINQANKNASEALDFWLFPGMNVTEDVDLKAARALAASYKGLGITADEVGRYGDKQAELGCKDYVPSSGSGILSTTQAKDSLRPAEGAAPAAGGEGAKGEEAPVEEMPAEEMPAEEAPVEEAPAAAPGGRRLRLF
ncbi:hypothetical protein Rsub_02892 [Raphidocelis subcapitata]|uniref:Uncharacterized protein n=1 Tax=Raphidocelis subcapitata TaxID=307507 RepID=A0A2V0NST2_9CHLO|nr:hypothetical protein Rsub_02892 [Raphidocelis subcapitata]|eukprot:GBF89722.1 hypothetical protein Rsub_02892 [Raphidocelis subcapitata]